MWVADNDVHLKRGIVFISGRFCLSVTSVISETASPTAQTLWIGYSWISEADTDSTIWYKSQSAVHMTPLYRYCQAVDCPVSAVNARMLSLHLQNWLSASQNYMRCHKPLSFQHYMVRLSTLLCGFLALSSLPDAQTMSRRGRLAMRRVCVSELDQRLYDVEETFNEQQESYEAIERHISNLRQSCGCGPDNTLALAECVRKIREEHRETHTHASLATKLPHYLTVQEMR